MGTLTSSRDTRSPVGCVRDTVITHSRLAWRYERAQAAAANRHGLQALPIEGLAARLAGGFLQPIDPDALKAAITKALAAELGDLNRIKDLPGFPRAAAATLSKAWTAGLNLAELAATARPETASRLAAVTRLEEEVIRHLPSSMRRPADLVSAALQRMSYRPHTFRPNRGPRPHRNVTGLAAAPRGARGRDRRAMDCRSPLRAALGSRARHSGRGGATGKPGNSHRIVRQPAA